ncbi:MAG: hypothetical protein MJ188_08930 [Treponema sp.]|nr:hypothetical protein [Treponema sp.]
MKKIVLALASAAVLFSMVSCASKDVEDSDLEAPEGFEMEVEDDGLLHLEYKYLGMADGSTCTSIPAAQVITNKDYSKPHPVDIYCDAPEYVEFAGEKCVKIPSNGDGNIRVIWLFDEPVPADSVTRFAFSCAGLDIPLDNTWTANIALMYNNDITAGEHATAMYPLAAALDGFITKDIDLTSEEGIAGLWGNGFKPEGEFLGIQIYYGGRDPIFIKDLILE